MPKPTRPILRYFGGKWRIAHWIISRMPPHRTYVEPYGGAASVLLQKPRSYAEVYNDIDGEIVNVFRVMRDSPGRICRDLRRTPYARDEYHAAFPVTEDPIEAARRTIIRAFMGFGGNAINRKVKSGWRSNIKRQHTTPADDWAGLPRQVGRFAKRLRGVFIENKDAIALMRQHDDPEALFYVDCPYLHSTRGKHRYSHELTDEDHATLAEVLHGLKAMVLLSGYRSDLYDRLYKTWKCDELAARGESACERTEALWLNAAVVRRLEMTDGLFNPPAEVTRG